MVGETPFPFSKYKGKSIAYIALTDYPFLAFIHDKIKIPSLRYEVSRVRKALNSFTPVYNCMGNCGNLPTRFSFATDSMRHTWVIDDPYWFCTSDTCAHSTGLDGPQLFLPIKYDSILKFALGGIYRQSRKDMLAFHKVLNDISGFKGTPNEQSAQEFIDDLVRKTNA
ncbi:MAG: hypothetical protein QXT19_03390 [Candidatus Woesearchaeota archaeon]